MDTKAPPKTLGELPQSSPSPLEVTPSNTTVTLPTPDSVHAQLVGIDCHNPPRFIFYPISWDGLEDPSAQSKRPCLNTQKGCTDDDPLNPSPTTPYFTDTFRLIDRWRRDVVDWDGNTTGLLDPIQDAPLPLRSLPHDHHGGLIIQGTQPVRPPPRRANSTGSEDEVQLWIHP